MEYGKNHRHDNHQMLVLFMSKRRKKTYCWLYFHLSKSNYWTKIESIKWLRYDAMTLMQIFKKSSLPRSGFYWRLVGHMRNQKIHSQIFTIHKLINFVSNSLGHPLGISVGIIFMIEGSPWKKYYEINYHLFPWNIIYNILSSKFMKNCSDLLLELD